MAQNLAVARVVAVWRFQTPSLGDTDMIAAEIIGQVLAASGRMAADGADLVLTAPNRYLLNLLDSLKVHQPAIVAALAHPDLLWWRVAILEPGGRTVEVDTPSGWTLADWQPGPGCAVTAIAGLPRPHRPTSIRPWRPPARGWRASLQRSSGRCYPPRTSPTSRPAASPSRRARLHPVICRGYPVGAGGAHPGRHCYRHESVTLISASAR
jgi:hypothetical protein